METANQPHPLHFFSFLFIYLFLDVFDLVLEFWSYLILWQSVLEIFVYAQLKRNQMVS